MVRHRNRRSGRKRERHATSRILQTPIERRGGLQARPNISNQTSNELFSILHLPQLPAHNLTSGSQRKRFDEFDLSGILVSSQANLDKALDLICQSRARHIYTCIYI